MRLWSIHPSYLDTKGLIACWREGLLARKALSGKTKGYKNHPQLQRFKSCSKSLIMPDTYLLFILKDARKRGFNFQRKKIGPNFSKARITVTKGQIEYEFKHLLKKLKRRDRKKYIRISRIRFPKPHPIFRVVKGAVEWWEKLEISDRIQI